MGTDENTAKPPGFRLGYVRALDGLRGVAILLVLLTHLDLLGHNYGFIGVDVFFVLSGFLITCLLLQEQDQNGRISLRAFYARRALRLLPALFAMVAVFVAYFLLCHPRKLWWPETRETAATLAYVTNWVVALDLFPTSFLAHTWSLSIEEQFYLIWPLVLIWLARRQTRISLFYLAILGAFLAILDRFLLASGTSAGYWRLARGLDSRADALLLGCAGGILFSGVVRPVWLGKGLRLASVPALICLLLMGQFCSDYDEYMYVGGWFAISLLGAVVVLAVGLECGGILQKALSNPLLVYLGKISYGLYLWHWPILLAMNESKASWAHHRSVKFAMMAGAALASYYLLERPCLRLKRRFEKTT